MHIHTSIYTYILFTACGPLKHQRVMSGRRNQVFRTSKYISCPKALYHLDCDNIFRITVVVADWLG